MKTREF